MKLSEIQEILGAEVLTGEEMLDFEVGLGCASDLMSDVLAYGKPESILLTGLTNPQVVRTVEMADIKAICFVRNKRPDAQTIELASRKDLVIMATGLPMFEACGLLYSRGLVGVGYVNTGARR
jgi:hypothetical protein